MCEVCKGSYTIVHKSCFGMYLFQACPLCGSMPAPLKAKKNKKLEKRLAEAEKQFEKKETPGGGAA